jgi:Lon protease-like protein
LVGVSRVRMLRELKQEHLYREFEVELVEDAQASDTSLREALFELVARLPAEVATRLIQTTSHVEGGALADIVASTITQDANRRLEILNELDSARRIEEVADDVLILAAGLKPKKPEGLMN